MRWNECEDRYTHLHVFILHSRIHTYVQYTRSLSKLPPVDIHVLFRDRTEVEKRTREINKSGSGWVP